jgi:hypothetical protein
MSKNLFKIILLAIATSYVFASCSKGEENPLVETVWASSYGQYVLWIEFTSDSDFLNYMGDDSGNTNTTGVTYGKYNYSNGAVNFTSHNSTSPFDKATVSGSVMELTYKSGFSRTFKKKK